MWDSGCHQLLLTCLPGLLKCFSNNNNNSNLNLLWIEKESWSKRRPCHHPPGRPKKLRNVFLFSKLESHPGGGGDCTPLLSTLSSPCPFSWPMASAGVMYQPPVGHGWLDTGAWGTLDHWHQPRASAAATSVHLAWLACMEVICQELHWTPSKIFLAKVPSLPSGDSLWAAGLALPTRQPPSDALHGHLSNYPTIKQA